VGIIGSGMIGGTVARLSVAAGYHVVLSNSRGPETGARSRAPRSTAAPTAPTPTRWEPPRTPRPSTPPWSARTA